MAATPLDLLAQAIFRLPDDRRVKNPLMKPVVVVYATREGQTKRIADHVAASLRERGLDVIALDIRQAEARLDLGAYSAALLAASVHAGQHAREIVDFVKTHRQRLQSMP